MKTTESPTAARIQLVHPQGKKAVTMDANVYRMLHSEIIHYVAENGPATFAQIVQAVEIALQRKGFSIEGSLRWYAEWVKLHLEATKVLERIPKTSPQRYVVTSSPSNT